MPSSMPHLLTARKTGISTDFLFYIGSLAPDSVTDRNKKDIVHFRNSTDREKSLIDLAAATDQSFSFKEGVLMHLFLDWKWDIGPSYDFRKHYGNDCFLQYRDEIGRLGSCLYHNIAWSEELWNGMLVVKPEDYPLEIDFNPSEVITMLNRNNIWHKNNELQPQFYETDEMNAFFEKVAVEYNIWRRIHTWKT